VLPSPLEDVRSPVLGLLLLPTQTPFSQLPVLELSQVLVLDELELELELSVLLLLSPLFELLPEPLPLLSPLFELLSEPLPLPEALPEALPESVLDPELDEPVLGPLPSPVPSGPLPELAGQAAGQEHDGFQVELDEPLPWQTLPASDGTEGHLSTPSRIAIAIPPEK